MVILHESNEKSGDENCNEQCNDDFVIFLPERM